MTVASSSRPEANHPTNAVAGTPGGKLELAGLSKLSRQNVPANPPHSRYLANVSTDNTRRRAEPITRAAAPITRSTPFIAASGNPGPPPPPCDIKPVAVRSCQKKKKTLIKFAPGL